MHQSCVVFGGAECAAGRDAKTPLCGSCLPGLSELLFSGVCKECSAWNWPLIAGFFFLYTGAYFYFHFMARIEASSHQESTVIQLVLSKCLTYFYQTLPLMLAAGSVHGGVQPLLTVFSLRAFDGDSGGICIIPGMDAMQKLMLPLSGAAYLSMLAVTRVAASWLKKWYLKKYSVQQLQFAELKEILAAHSSEQPMPTDDTNSATQCAPAESPDDVYFDFYDVAAAHLSENHAPADLIEGCDESSSKQSTGPDAPVELSVRPRRTDHAQGESVLHQRTNRETKRFQVTSTALYASALFQYSTIALVSLRLVDCQQFDQTLRAYYAPAYKCFSDYDPSWRYFVFVLVAAVVLFPGCVVFVAWKTMIADKPSFLTLPYTPRFWWYEGHLMFRRLVLIIFSVVPISNGTRQGLMICGCVVILCLHMQWRPFKDERVNTCETLMLVLLTMIAGLSGTVGAPEVSYRVHCSEYCAHSTDNFGR